MFFSSYLFISFAIHLRYAFIFFVLHFLMLISFYYRIGDFTVALWMFEAFEEESYQGRLGKGENSRNIKK